VLLRNVSLTHNVVCFSFICRSLADTSYSGTKTGTETVYYAGGSAFV